MSLIHACRLPLAIYILCLPPVNTLLRCKFLKEIITSKNFLAEFVLALCVVFKKYLFM